MSRIASAPAYANNEVAFIAWTLSSPIDKCLGFEITRIYLDHLEETVLPAWVAFKGQSNATWAPQTTSVGPVQMFTWRDLTARRRRNATELRPAGAEVKYRIRPLVPRAAGLEPVTNIPAKSYTGNPVPLSYFDEGAETNEVKIIGKYGDIRVAFTNGILSAQWLSHTLQQQGESLDPQSLIQKHLSKQGDPIRQYLTGDVLAQLRSLLDLAAQKSGKLRMALYELDDGELKNAILANQTRTELILSNTSKDKQGRWDTENAPARTELATALGPKLHNRMFNNEHIGHNKFVILEDSTGPQAVLTGSTNWTPNGLCAQSNNAMVITSVDVAKCYAAYWDQLLADTNKFKTPKPLSAPSSNVQGKVLRQYNEKPPQEIVLQDGTSLTIWFSPNTDQASKPKTPATPPDLVNVYSLMRKAHDIILFAVFLPSRSGKTSIIEEAVTLGTKDPNLMVYGAISDPTAMPNYAPPPPRKVGNAASKTDKKPSPAIFDSGRTHLVLARALSKGDIVGDFEAELLKAGHAIIHDKIVVVDPLSDYGFVVMGSHNLGYKASYGNDENLLIIRNNSALVQAYAVHVLDVYDHYRFRAVQEEMKAKKASQKAKEKAGFTGFLSLDSRWMTQALTTEKGDLARYFAQAGKTQPVLPPSPAGMKKEAGA